MTGAEMIERARTVDILEVARRYTTLKRVGVNEWAGPCPRCAGRDRFAVNARKRLFNCRGCADGGDVIRLVEHIERCSFSMAVGKLAGDRWRPSTGGEPVTAADTGKAVPDRSQEDDEAKSAKACKRWAEAIDPRNTIVEPYLADRGLELIDDIAGRVIRFHPRCPWRDDDGSLIFVPAMICAMRSILSDELTAIHRTRLSPDGQKVGRRMLGVAAGAAVKLDADENVLQGLHVCEGVESGIAGRMLDLRPMWCLGSKNSIEAFPVLGGVECLTILAEPDAEVHVKKCAERWAQAGREVRIVRPTHGKDLNDAIRGDA